MPSPLENRLLSSIPSKSQARLFKHLELVTLSRDDILNSPGINLTHVFFPVDAIFSVLYDLADGSSTEIAMIGNEGLLGVAVFMGGESTPSRAVVIKAGCAYRISAKRMKDEFNRREEVLALTLRYTQSLISQMAQTAICNRHHSLSQQLCRFILLFLDRSRDNKLAVTHDLIAQLLGVRREGISTNASKLQSFGAIECHRGYIVINDRILLEEHCCECYQAVRSESERLFSIA